MTNSCYIAHAIISLIDEALSQIVPFSRTYYLGYTLYDKTRTSNKLLAIDVSLDKSTLLEIKSLLH